MSNRKGFTLIELLIVVVIIGILAAIAIPKFAATKDKAKLASVKTDLRNLETAQEAYFSDANTYGAFSDLQSASNFTLSAGNAVTAEAHTDGGYSMTITNSSISKDPKACSVAVGAAATDPTKDGVIECTATTP
jgi:prepilin-type N-terminal cleavage/methylation domain-containing protein